METIKNYTGTDVALANAFLDLEVFIGDAERDGDADAAVSALNLLIDRANGSTAKD